MKRKRFFRTVVADAIFVLGLAAIVVGVAMSGHVPAAVVIAGVECVGMGVMLTLSERGEDEH